MSIPELGTIASFSATDPQWLPRTRQALEAHGLARLRLVLPEGVGGGRFEHPCRR